MREFVLDIGGIEHTVQMTDEDAKRSGAREKKVQTRAKAPRNKEQ
ncbi:hypothetical protein [Rhodococcus spongiicola]|nr:hypothetical protein [Rhodococcus spongiicola]